jgi:hypothetical protein
MIKRILFLIVVSLSVSYPQFLGPRISTQQVEHDFGEIPAGKTVTHYFILSNTGDDNLLIKNVHASCGCTAAKPEKDKLAPGETTKLRVQFNSAGRKGHQVKTITVQTNDPKNPELKLKITGDVMTDNGKVSGTGNAPVIYFPQTEHNFGKVKEGKIAEYTFKFANKGESLLEIKDVHTSCGCTAALLSSKKLEPGKEGTLKVELDTKNRKGKLSRTITIVSNDVKEPSKVLTILADIEK